MCELHSCQPVFFFGMTSGVVFWLVTQESLGIHRRQNSNLMYLDLNNHFKHSSLQFKFAIIELEIGIHNNCKL